MNGHSWTRSGGEVLEYVMRCGRCGMTAVRCGDGLMRRSDWIGDNEAWVVVVTEDCDEGLVETVLRS